jgi:AcrR family transcriptional regulator
MSDSTHFEVQNALPADDKSTRPSLLSPGASAKRHAATARCDAMIGHARAQIMAVGVDRFNINEVLRQAGGSKATLVKYFGDRTGLIAAAIGAEARSAMAELGFDTAFPLSMPLGEALELVLGGVLRFYLQPGALSLYRAVVGAASSDPRGAAGFYHEGHAVIISTIAQILENRKGRDVRDDIDSLDVADQLVHAIRAGLYERALIGLDPSSIPEAAIKCRITATLALVLPGLAIHS